MKSKLAIALFLSAGILQATAQASANKSQVDPELQSRLCSAFQAITRYDRDAFFKEALRLMKEKNVNLEDIYFEVHCGNGVADYLLHQVALVENARYFVAYFQYREKQTGKSILPGILNRPLTHFVSDAGPKQTLLDYLSYCSDNSSLTEESVRGYKALISFYVSVGAKHASELQGETPRSG